MTHLSPIDLTIVAAYLIAITIFGLRFSRKSRGSEKSLKSYFLADNTIPWWAIALSIVSAETSTLTIISIPGVAFAGNLGFLQVVLGYMLGRIVVALLFLPKYFRGEMLTAYQLIDQRFGHALHKVTAGLFLLTRAAAEGVRVFAISIVVGIAIGTGDTLSIAIISALTLLYTFEGGMAAVIWTDVVQMGLYILGTIAAMWTLGLHVPGGWTQIHAVAAPLGKFHWLDFSFTLTKSYTFWAGVLGGTFLTMASHGTDQLMVQRMLAARNLRESRLALLSSGLVIFLQFTLFLLIGVGLFVFYGVGDIHSSISALSPDRIFPTFIVHEMPHGVAGLLIAAILAAAMSNLSAALNSLASTTVIDFYVPFRAWRQHRQTPTNVRHSERSAAQSKNPEAAQSTSTARTSQPTEAQASTTDHRNNTFISRLATVFWALILFAIAVYSIRAGGKGHVVETGLSIASVAYGCLLGVFLLGTLTRYATQGATIAAMLLGFLFNLALWQATLSHPFVPMPFMPHIAFTWYVLIGSLVTFALGSLFSLLLPRKRSALAAMLVLALSSFASFAAPPSRNALSSSASRYPEASASGLSVPTEKAGLQPLGQTLAAPLQPPDFTPISTLLNQAIAAHKLPGAVVLIGHNGNIVFHHAYGNRALEPTLEPMTEDTIFDMASLTKVLVTTTAILQLYEAHKLDLDTPIAHYLPDFASPSYPSSPSPSPLSSFAAGGGPASHPSLAAAQSPYKSQITIRQLLTHYSGLPEDVDLKDDWGLAQPDKAEGIRRALAAIPYGPPGQTFKYSDINFITLGYLVEKLSGEPLDDYATDHIFKPLHMFSTEYHSFYKVCSAYTSLGSAIFIDRNRMAFDQLCMFHTWSINSVLNTAPTAHDDQGTALTNPNFDHLLRGTVHDPTTRRMGGVAGHAGVFSTAQDMSLFCQALLDKLTKNTGPFPLSQATLKLATSPNEPATAAATATIFTPDGQTTKGVASRGLGWDLNSPFSRARGAVFPITTATRPGSFGHTGFTGTSLWLDPASNTYVILLANAIHIPHAASISPLRGQTATAAAIALKLDPCHEPNVFCDPPVTYGLPPMHTPAKTVLGAPHLAPEMWASGEARPPSNLQQLPASRYPKASALGLPPGPTESGLQPLGQPLAPLPNTQTGIDILEQTNFAALKALAKAHHNHLRLALLTNRSSLDSAGKRTIDILAKADPTLELKTLFAPEHGLFAHQDTEHLTSETDPTTHIPIIELYGPKSSDKHPRQQDLKQLDAVVIDLQDAGTRFWTYETLTGYFLEACAQAHVEVIVLDRPNPLGGVSVQGTTSDPGLENYTDFMPLPLRHGLTLGELARYFNANATQVQYKPELLDARATHIGEDTPEAKPAATQPGLHAQLTVIPMQHWSRTQYFAETGLTWTPPSPNLKSPAAAILYPAVGLTEQTNISVGRGTDASFESLGAPYLNAAELAQYLTKRNIPGIAFTPTTLTIAETPEHYPSHGQTIPAIHFTVTDPTALDSPELGIELLSALHLLYPTQFKLDLAKNLLANAATLAALKAARDPRDIATSWSPALKSFQQARTPFLLY